MPLIHSLKTLLYTLVLSACWQLVLPTVARTQASAQADVLTKSNPISQGTPSPQPGSTWRLDDFTRTWDPNTLPKPWMYHKIFPLFGSSSNMLLQFVHTPIKHYIHMRSGPKDFFGVGVKGIETRQWPVWEWSWRVSKIPRGGDVRNPKKNDQAGSVCLYDKLSPLNIGNGVCYLWENTVPKNTWYSSRNLHTMVLRNVTEDGLNRWYREKRNVAADYRRLFKRLPPRKLFFVLTIDADSTQSVAEVFYRDIVLHKR